MIDTSKYTNVELHQMFLEQKRQRNALCFITSSRRADIKDKKRATLHHGFEDLLNKKVNLYKYVKKEKAKQLIIVYQIFDIENDEKYNIERNESTSFDNRKELRTYPMMTKEEYKQYISCNTTDALKLLCKKTLEGISALKKYEKRLNFDWRGLNAELEDLFRGEFGSF